MAWPLQMLPQSMSVSRGQKTCVPLPPPAKTIIFLNFYFIAIVIVRELNNTFKNLLRAKGCQSIYKDMG